MSDYGQDWGSSDNSYGYSHNENDGYSHNEHEQSYGDNENQSHGDVNAESQEDNSSHEQETSGESLSYENIEKYLVTIPSNVRSSDAIFSDRDVYKIVNILMVLGECSDKVISWMDNAMGISGKENVRRAISIINMEKKELDEKVTLITAVKDIHDSSIIKEGENPMTKVLEAVGKVDSLTEDQRSEMLSLVRKIIKTSGNKSLKVTSTRSSSSVDIINDIVNVTTGENSISSQVDKLGSLIDTIYQIATK